MRENQKDKNEPKMRMEKRTKRWQRKENEKKKKQKKQKKKNQMMEHSKSSPHDNVIETFLFIFYSSLAYTLCRESKIRDVCAKG